MQINFQLLSSFLIFRCYTTARSRQAHVSFFPQLSRVAARVCLSLAKEKLMNDRSNSPRCTGGLLRLGIIMGSVLFALPLTATAQSNNCLQDEFGGNTQCTSKDVKIAFATNPRDLTGNPKLTCIAGTHFSFVADFHITTTATARENIGMYFATNGQGSALKGMCSDNIIAPSHASPNPQTT